MASPFPGVPAQVQSGGDLRIQDLPDIFRIYGGEHVLWDLCQVRLEVLCRAFFVHHAMSRRV